METLTQFKKNLESQLFGQELVIEQLLIGIIAGGHLLLEGPPGVGKTHLVRSVSKLLNLPCRRVQFTADLMPSDLIGTNIWNPIKGEFFFRKGSLFTDLLIGDELNRAPPRTQAALLEAMEERQVSVDGCTMPLSRNFTVIATQNPFEYEGTYSLPEAQFDRFLLCIPVNYPSKAHGRRLLAESILQPDTSIDGHCDLSLLRENVKKVHVEPLMFDYINELVHMSREMPEIALGASPRAGIMLLKASKARAIVHGRDYVIPEDVQALASVVLAHRLKLSPEAMVEGTNAQRCIDKLLETVAIPR